MHQKTDLASLRLLLTAVSLGAAACSTGGADPSADPAADSPSISTPRAHTSALRQPRGPAVLGNALADDAGAHLAISLRRQHEEGLAALLRDQQDPSSPRFHAWLSPEAYGATFGVSEGDYARVASWLRAAGLLVTAYPNRLFLDATGTVAQVRTLLGVQLREATSGGRRFRSHAEEPALPDDIASLVIKIGGLDTRPRLHHRMNVEWYGSATQALDADDFRTLYDMPTTDVGAAGLTLAVLGTQEGTQPSNPNDYPGPPFVPPDPTAINDYLTTLSHATATYTPIVLPNTDDDFDTPGSNGEYELDVEMQSVGAPNAKELALVLSPTSVVFQTGAQYIVNRLPQAVAVSTSLGLCESEEIGYDGGAPTDPTSDAYILRQAVQQGLAEGQTWFAASGDMGADDCNDTSSGTGNGFGGGNATVDFPCSAPEVLCVGGTMFEGHGTWSPSGALTQYDPEMTCNEGQQGVGGGGGQSMLYKKPTYQTGVGPEKDDGQRDLPDIALMAASNTPGVVDYDCGEGVDACPDAGTGIALLDLTGGTSVASPLAAGMFAHLAGDVGCRLGDVHSIIYALGAAQQANPGPDQPFHDITTGNNDWVDPKHTKITGFTAGPGYDLATGWGSIDLAKLVKAWPPCAKTDGGPLPMDAGQKDATITTDATPGADAGPPRGVDASHAPMDAGTPHPDAGRVGTDAGGSPARDASAGGDDTAGSDGGCGCVAAGLRSRPAAPRGGLAALGVIGAVLVRRRRRRR